MRTNHIHYYAPPVDSGPDLFTPPAVRVDTSLEAAARIKPHVARVREAIFLWLKTQGSHGATAGEICTALGLSGSTVRPRLVELRGEAKWAPKLPQRIRRLSARRSGMRVYEVS